jgi:hypothetical protein
LVAVGAPIPTTQHDNPPREMVESIHAQFCTALSDLFDAHKHKYGIDKNVKLEYY